jgi:SAM-dependent methyltransferase
MQQDSHDRVQWVYSSTTNQELEERYDQWAAEYDKDLAEEFEWNAPQTAVDLFARHVPPGARILDAGAGTGLVGECLAQAGYQDLYAMDLSLGMLEEARNKNLYQEFHQMTLGETLDFDTDSFDSVISVGVFTTGHAPAHAFDELARITKSGGFIVFSLRVDLYEEGGFKEYFGGLEEAGKWKLAELSEPYYPLPKGEPDVIHRIWAYQVTA